MRLFRITDEAAELVLREWTGDRSYPSGGGEFVQLLLAAIVNADDENRSRLFAGFPELVTAWELACSGWEGREVLARITARLWVPPECSTGAGADAAVMVVLVAAARDGIVEG